MKTVTHDSRGPALEEMEDVLTQLGAAIRAFEHDAAAFQDMVVANLVGQVDEAIERIRKQAKQEG